jgi:hypothetical protein
MRIAILLAVLLAFGCASSGPWPASGVFTGYYEYGFEESRFVPAGTKENWWLSGSVPCKEVSAKADPFGPTPILYLEVRGTLSSEGKYGHLDAYTRELTAQEFLTCRKLLPNERPEF